MILRNAASIIFAATLALGTMACGDDGGDNDTNTTSDATSDDASTDDDAAGEADGTTADEDASGPTDPPEPVDPCENACLSAPATECNDAGEVVTYEAPGTCTVVDDAASCEFASSAAACGEGTSCINGMCVAPGNPADYTFSDKASFVNSLGLAEDDPATDADESDCCFDFDGDEELDNGLGTLLGSLAGLLGPDLDVNALIQEAIDDGTIAILFEQVGLDDATTDDDVVLNGFFGTVSEDGSYSVDPDSFITGTAQPLISFQGSIADGVVSAGPAEFALTLPLDDFGITLDLVVQDTEIESNVAMAADGNGLDWTDGKLGGVVPLQQVVNAINGLGDTCACLGLEGSPLLEVAQEDKIGCSAAASAIGSGSCTEDVDGSLCAGIGDNMSLVCLGIGIIKPDIDTDSSGKPDSFSLGLRFAGVSAVISGVEATDEEPALGNIAEVATEAGFSTLVSALVAAELDTTIATGGPFTVFAPTDEAFANFIAASVDFTSAEDLLAFPGLSDVLLYHVVSGSVDAATVVTLTEAETLQGGKIAIDATDGVVLNGSVNVTATDVPASNGLIHIIDGVLTPPAADDTGDETGDGTGDETGDGTGDETGDGTGDETGDGTGDGTGDETELGNIAEVATDAGFSTLVAALVAAELDTTIATGGPFTVFAPTDEAFTNFIAASVDFASADDLLAFPGLSDVLLYHVVSGEVDAATVVTLTEAETMQGGKISIDATDGVVLNGSVNVTTTDVPASNGLIHIIDGVLMPPAADDTDGM